MPKKSSNSVKIHYPKLSREKLIQLLKEKAHSLSKELPIKTMMLFGSYATEEHTAFSDIDLFIVIKDENKDHAYRKICKNIRLSNIELHSYTSEEYEKLKRNSPSFIKEIEKKGITIFEA